jgi:molybdopterin-guanine dinucleotide biosynthesis protein A
MARPSLTIAILAGGAASRLGGCDKGLVLFDGRTLVVVANRNPGDYARRARTVADAIPGCRGPLAGVAAALAACATPWLLTLPVDCPDPPVELHARLADAAARHAADALVAHDGERRQPLFALYRRELADTAAAAAADGQGVAHWQDALGACDVDFADRRRQFINLNTPEDFAAHGKPRR